MDVEITRLAVDGLHHRGGRGHNAKGAACPDPINVTVAVHDDRSGRDALQAADEPVSVDQRGPDPLRKGLHTAGIFDDVMVDSDDPARARILRDGEVDRAHLPERYKAKRIGE